MQPALNQEACSLELDGVSKVVDDEVCLSGVSLRCDPGSFVVLLGRTRAGKTSLLRVIAGLERPSAGRIRWGNADVTTGGVRSRDVAMVYQQFVNYPSLTVYENTASPLRVRGKLARNEIDRRVRETAARLRLDGLLQRLPAELSGGQQQRTAIARALAKGASMVLLDEPLANLDYKLREELRAELRSLFEDSAKIVIYATAEPAEAMAIGGAATSGTAPALRGGAATSGTAPALRGGAATSGTAPALRGGAARGARIAVMDEGRIVQLGPALEVYAAPATQRVAQVISDPEINLLEVEVTPTREVRLSDNVTFTLSEHLRDLAPGRYRFGLRANHLRLARSSPADICLPSAALLEEISGSETRLHAACGSHVLTAQISGVHRHPLGTSLQLFIAPKHIFAFALDGRTLAPAQYPWFRLPHSPSVAHGTH